MIAAVEERLQKILSRAGFASRRGAEGLMQEGRVTVNGQVVKELGTKADPSRDDIRVDGVRVKAARERVYIVLNKPRGVVTTRSDPSGRQTVMSLVPDVKGLFPVGRLDLTTEGLILLTNDGEFAERVAHPRFEVPRVYHAKVRGVPDGPTLARLRRGVRIQDDVLVVDQVRLVNVDRHAWVEVTLHEGKQHEVKRVLEAVGHPVSKLRRVAFGPVTLRGLEPGQFRVLTPREIAGLLRGAPSPPIPARRVRRRPRPAGAGRAAPGGTGSRRELPGSREDRKRGSSGRGTDRAGVRGAGPRKGSTGAGRGATGRGQAAKPGARGTGARRGSTASGRVAGKGQGVKPRSSRPGGSRPAGRRGSGGSRRGR
jgi:23S rRNA pseudouridine2605 synthase